MVLGAVFFDDWKFILLVNRECKPAVLVAGGMDVGRVGEGAVRGERAAGRRGAGELVGTLD